MERQGEGAEVERLYRPGEVAEMLRVRPWTVARWARAGLLPERRTLGGQRRYPADVVDALVESGAGMLPGAGVGAARAVVLDLVEQHFGGDGAAALRELAAGCRLAVVRVDREWFAAYLRARGHTLTDAQWGRIAGYLDAYCAEWNRGAGAAAEAFAVAALEAAGVPGALSVRG
ncbi:helix-turn-helix domain-containing protein [Spirillospora sp. CA-255316]